MLSPEIRSIAVLSTLAAVLSEPMWQNLCYGQINSIPIWLLMESLLARSPVVQGLGGGFSGLVAARRERIPWELSGPRWFASTEVG